MSHIDTEHQLLQRIILNPADFLKVELKSSDFLSRENQAIFEAINKLFDKNKNIELHEIEQVLISNNQKKAKQKLKEIIIYDSENKEFQPIKRLAQNVQNNALNRRIEFLGLSIAQQAKEGLEGEKLLSIIYNKLEAIDKQEDNTGDVTLTSAIVKLRKEMEKPKKNRIIKTGFADIDNAVGGIPSELLTVIAARPSMGKSAVALNIMANIANQGHKVYFASLEDTNHYVGARAVSRFADIPNYKLTQGIPLTLDEIKRFDACMDTFQHQNILINDKTSQTASSIRRSVARLKKQGKIDILFVDHLGEINSNVKGREYDIVSDNVRKIRDIAKDFNIAVVLLCQLSRNGEKEERPKLGHLRGSGRIEEAARNVWTLYRPGQVDRSADPSFLELDILKCSHGKTGLIKMKLDTSRMKMESWTEGEY